MIQLTKLNKPQWLIDNAAVKTREYIDAPANNKPSPWRNKQVMSTLNNETNGKCMYCEAFVNDTSYIAVEHVAPKSVFPDRVLDWDNLGLACPRCNTSKGTYWSDSPAEKLINPYVDIIDEHFFFSGPLTMAVPGSPRAVNTLRKLKFKDRIDLFLSRVASIEKLDIILRQWHDASEPSIKLLLREDILSELDKKNEHSAVLKAYAVQFGFESNPDAVNG